MRIKAKSERQKDGAARPFQMIIVLSRDETLAGGGNSYGTEGVKESEKNSSSGSPHLAVKSLCADSTTIGAPQA